ncbi:oxidative stress-responsive serine-rich protein 1 isoform X1 [Anolis carolinensis]|uniref:Oxidative stress-responsive serine-rich protein 1 n=1 Tax=Anolis carolinensis TaxID=28377 RepID=A0A803U0X7_ANOCA|nr:PREDICTED: oxidative stress-responsive serine-rich protein 1 isoform X1 [Anolis carolinensis]XP_003220660.1 PREDICTED: oxidative stress-responsive serine-rich protein 1 isoform X1 [Anolis carolinensis]XP_003220661.1 PREDICTED: oxidative stress-responsive serine-rich protein 1 isoform X1 [Anolis carolinensis]|eukprot:XP_003220659.1 PREDICTED: oxidative stress-responsive serine-rich protein 1 isoform X1 [Anolis carolinensis]
MSEIEENLQAAFKKLRVDSEGSTISLPVNEGTSSKAFLRTSDEDEMKTASTSKESWHWCLRKPVRGAVRTQRRRRSKSPVLHPPKFIHRTIKLPTHNQPLPKNAVDTSDHSCDLSEPNSDELSKNKQASCTLNNVEKLQTAAKHSGVSMATVQQNTPESSPTAILKATDPSDFHSVSEQNKGSLCACVDKTCQCTQWQDMRVYMFSGLQNALQSVPEKATHMQDNSKPLPSRTPSCSLRSCSEQARAHVDDVTIEDLSGYMEYFLHIPKKMSHMAEMMYT